MLTWQGSLSSTDWCRCQLQASGVSSFLSAMLSTLPIAETCRCSTFHYSVSIQTFMPYTTPCGPKPKGGHRSVRWRYRHRCIAGTQIFERLWEHEPLDVDVNRSHYGQWCLNEPLLTVAAGGGRLSIAKTIVARARGTVDLNRADSAGDYTPLKQAARAGENSFAEWLLGIGGDDIDLEFGQDREDATALWSAGETLSYEIAEMLLQRGAKPDVECYGSDTYGHGPEYLATPLWRAAYNGSARMAAVLLTGGASIHGKGRAKHQSLHNPAMSRPHGPLTQAAYGGHAEIVRLLVNKHGADPAEVDDEIDNAELGCKLRGFIRKAVEDETVLSWHKIWSSGLPRGEP